MYVYIDRKRDFRKMYIALLFISTQCFNTASYQCSILYIYFLERR